MQLTAWRLQWTKWILQRTAWKLQWTAWKLQWTAWRLPQVDQKLTLMETPSYSGVSTCASCCQDLHTGELSYDKRGTQAHCHNPYRFPSA